VPAPGGVINCVLGYTHVADYASDAFYMGATLGRYANRIRGARTNIAGRERQLSMNEKDSGHCLHGGEKGFDRCIWSMSRSEDGTRVDCTLTSADGDQGFPGELDVRVTYRIVGKYALSIELLAVTRAETIVNLANHAYFNLDRKKSTIDTHGLSVFADHYTPADESKIPTGEILAVDGTRFDLRRATSLASTDPSKPMEKIFDHNFVLPERDGTLREVAELHSKESGIVLRILSTQPGVQVYTGDYLSRHFAPRQGLCLEAQNFPDAPNQPAFPSALLTPGRVYRQETVYEFMSRQ
jgi:aldose 1-epimerase